VIQSILEQPANSVLLQPKGGISFTSPDQAVLQPHPQKAHAFSISVTFQQDPRKTVEHNLRAWSVFGAPKHLTYATLSAPLALQAGTTHALQFEYQPSHSEEFPVLIVCNFAGFKIGKLLTVRYVSHDSHVADMRSELEKVQPTVRFNLGAPITAIGERGGKPTMEFVF
jgi:hypothetical protein